MALMTPSRYEVGQNQVALPNGGERPRPPALSPAAPLRCSSTLINVDWSW